MSASTSHIPILAWLPTYQRDWLRMDLVAGLTAAAVVIPQAMAYASIAGLPIQVGLYVAILPMAIYAVLGTSRPLSVSTTSSLALLTASALAAAVGTSASPADYLVPSATLAFLVGLFLILASVLRLGFVAEFISLPVLTGFKAGIGVVIFVGQLPKVLGLSLPSGGVFATLAAIVENIGQISLPTVGLSLVMLAILLLLPRVLPRVPAPLVAVAVGIAMMVVLDGANLGIAEIGQIPSGFPSLSLPDLSLPGALWLPALGIALMSFTESSAAARAFRKHGDPIPEANRELFALGMANLGGSLFQGMPAGGGTSQTAVNSSAGAQTQVAQLVTVGVVILTLLFLAPVISLMPEATLGSLMLVAAAGLVKPDQFRDIATVNGREFRWALLAFFGVMLLGTLQGIVAAVLISVLSIFAEADRPPVYMLGKDPETNIYRSLADHPDDETIPGLLIARTEGRILFANAQWLVDQLTLLVSQEQPQALVLDCAVIPDFEYTALNTLSEFEAQLRDGGITFGMAQLNPTALGMVERSSLGKTLGQERLFDSLDEAVEAFSQQF